MLRSLSGTSRWLEMSARATMTTSLGLPRYLRLKAFSPIFDLRATAVAPGKPLQIVLGSSDSLCRRPTNLLRQLALHNYLQHGAILTLLDVVLASGAESHHAVYGR
jgi:hypothetical protein